MEQKHRTLIRVALAVGVLWVVFSFARDRLTAERRFYAALDAQVEALRQSGERAVALSALERERYLALLRCNDQPSRWRAAGDLARLRDKTFVPALVAAMQDDAGTRRTCLMAQSLGAIGDSNAVPALLQAIHHPRNLDLRVCATHALAEIDDARAVAPLIAKAENLALREDDRVSAIRALGDLARAEAVPALRRIAAGDADGRYRTIATAALRQIELMQADDPVPGLAAALNSPAYWIQRRWLIQKLGEHWDSRSAAALNQFLRRHDGWTSDRIQATALLLHHDALESGLVSEFASSSEKQSRWLAQYARAFAANSRDEATTARHDLAQTPPLSSLLP